MNGKETIPYDEAIYQQGHRVEFMVRRFKGWRRIATRCDRSPNVFVAAIPIAAIVIFWLKQ